MSYRCFRAICLSVVVLAPFGQVRADNLQDIYELALKNDPVLAAANASYRAGQEAKVQGRSSLLPQVSAQAQYGKEDYEQTTKDKSPFTSPVTDIKDHTQDYYLTVSQNLFNLPAWFSFQRGKDLSKQAEAQFAADQEELILRVVDTYFTVLRATDNLKSSKAEEAAFQRQLEQTQQRFEVGLIAITDVHEARAAYDNAVVNRLTDEGNLGVSYEALTVLTGQAHSNVWLLSEKFPVVPPQPAERDAWMDLALKGNFQLKASEYAAEAAQQSSYAAKSVHLPTLAGQVTVLDTDKDRDNNEPNIADSTAVEGNTIKLSLEVPLYAGGRISSQRRQAYEQYIAARETHTSNMRNTIQLTRSLHLAVVTDVERVKARQQSIISAQSALDATTAGYEVGTRNVVDVLNSQQVLTRAIRDYANTRYDYLVRLLRLRGQAGLLSPEDVQSLNQWLVEPGPVSKNAM